MQIDLAKRELLDEYKACVCMCVCACDVCECAHVWGITMDLFIDLDLEV